MGLPLCRLDNTTCLEGGHRDSTSCIQPLFIHLHLPRHLHQLPLYSPHLAIGYLLEPRTTTLHLNHEPSSELHR
ncbi:unnamed protein product [Mesocestoides corti]|uniref:Ovule protein n=1 Tax=Mesocestoides corti TaxID=53468 RepID=A0A0R3UL06_MESCO|nr:unnamed protein product [Mesocestoides corti]